MRLALLLSAFGLSMAIQCPNGSSYSNSTGNCYKFEDGGQYKSKTRSDAQSWCAAMNATLPIIRNAEENGYIYVTLPSNIYAWLGLTCTTSDPLSCVWDDGTPLRVGDYQNFAPGHPNPTSGSCVCMDLHPNTARQWFSIPCSQSRIATCEYEHGLQYSLCPDGSRYFNGKCYFGMVAYGVNDGTNKCTLAGGNMASIHSELENFVVFSVARLFEPTDFTILGISNNKYNIYTWTDGTEVNYKNFGFEDTQYGNCVEMSLIDDLIPSGSWVNSQCDDSTPVNVICKRAVENTPSISPDTAPAKCSSTIFLTGAGPIQSPSYPNSDANNCKYLVSVNAGDVASVSFSQISLDVNSRISFYNNLFDKTPFATLSSINIHETRTFNASGNSLHMTFATTGGRGNSFRGIFGPPMPSCNGQDVYVGNGTFTSPNYPANSPSGLKCQYLLHSSKNRVVLTFKTFSTSNDYLDIYDGYGTYMRRISGTQNNYTISSFSSSMRLVFHTSQQNQGFQAEFFSVV